MYFQKEEKIKELNHLIQMKNQQQSTTQRLRVSTDGGFSKSSENIVQLDHQSKNSQTTLGPLVNLERTQADSLDILTPPKGGLQSSMAVASVKDNFVQPQGFC